MVNGQRSPDAVSALFGNAGGPNVNQLHLRFRVGPYMLWARERGKHYHRLLPESSYSPLLLFGGISIYI